MPSHAHAPGHYERWHDYHITSKALVGVVSGSEAPGCLTQDDEASRRLCNHPVIEYRRISISQSEVVRIGLCQGSSLRPTLHCNACADLTRPMHGHHHSATSCPTLRDSAVLRAHASLVLWAYFVSSSCPMPAQLWCHCTRAELVLDSTAVLCMHPDAPANMPGGPHLGSII